MINIEDELFNTIASALREQYSGIFVTGEYVAQPPGFPAVFIVEQDNSVYQRGRDSGAIENYADVMYQVDVYSNRNIGKKAECKAIMAFVDAEFSRMGFARTFLNPVQNLSDPTIYRLTGRYKAVVDKNHYIYGG